MLCFSVAVPRTALDSTARLAHTARMKPTDDSFLCPHCGKPIPDSLITARSGQIGGKKTAQRGPDYFRKIAAMRKNRAGGRPKKTD